MKVILLFLLFTGTVFSQKKSLSKQEHELVLLYQKMRLESFSNDIDVRFDSLEIHSQLFKKKFFSFIEANPETLTYDFKALKKENINIVTSEDKVFRIYSWNTYLGGTMKDFEAIFQYRNHEKTYCNNNFSIAAEDDTYIPFYSQIFTLKTKSQTYYLVIENGIYSSKDCSQSIRIYHLDKNNPMQPVSLIKTKSGLTASINVYFDFLSVVNRPERPLELIKYDKENRIIYIPIVFENGQVTDKFLRYQFDGNHFIRMGSNKSVGSGD